MKISAKTDVGKVRSNNQDSYAAGDLTSEVSWAVVCDGMGGANGGAQTGPDGQQYYDADYKVVDDDENKK